MPKTILLEVRDRVATITLSRPEVRNAISLEMVSELHAALTELETRPDLHALVIGGAGGKAFAAGADIAELRERRRADAWKGINGGLFARIEAFPRPTVAAIVGFALGGGCELALACDFRIAGASSKFGQPEVGLGILAGAGATRRLPALVGLANARRLLLTGKVIDATEALRIGLVDQVVPDAEVPVAVTAWLEPILAAAPEAVRWTKAAIVARERGAGEDALQRLDVEAQGLLFEHPDKFARIDAFLAKGG